MCLLWHLLTSAKSSTCMRRTSLPPTRSACSRTRSSSYAATTRLSFASAAPPAACHVRFALRTATYTRVTTSLRGIAMAGSIRQLRGWWRPHCTQFLPQTEYAGGARGARPLGHRVSWGQAALRQVNRYGAPALYHQGLNGGGGPNAGFYYRIGSGSHAAARFINKPSRTPTTTTLTAS